MDSFELVAPFSPSGDQPQAIEQIIEGVSRGVPCQTLLGVTGSGKTFTMANIIARLNRPTLIISHNKTLAAQLYGEFKEFFPGNAVSYFVSYYDYYQPEAYIPASDTYIEKDSSRNDEIDKLRLRATASLFERRDVIIVASVSCIFGLGSPIEYSGQVVAIERNQPLGRDPLIRKLVDINYSRNDYEFGRGTFRVRGDTCDIHPAYDDEIVRVEFFGDTVERIVRIHHITNAVLAEMPRTVIYPATHFVTQREKTERALAQIELELAQRLEELRGQNKLVEVQRLEQRTRYDMEMIREVGYCSGIENYSRIFDGRPAGSQPYTLLDYFPKDFLLFIDESHVTIPQLMGMYKGDRSRKDMLVDYGFRLPCARDNRPLPFPEFEAKIGPLIYVSATPGSYELAKSQGIVVEQLLRPTGLLDPAIIIAPAKNQIDHLLGLIRERLALKERVMVTTLTKKMAEDLTVYLKNLGVPVRYMHSDIQTLERAVIIRDFRKGVFEVLVGINLLREGLDLPEVSLVAILDADKEGFLRSERSLIQTMGRASRNSNGTVVLYADTITDSISRAMAETSRRRAHQETYNKAHNIVPRTVVRKIEELLVTVEERAPAKTVAAWETETDAQYLADLMHAAAADLDFETAAKIRDRLKGLVTDVREILN